jgi:hypothetical protein
MNGNLASSLIKNNFLPIIDRVKGYESELVLDQ